VKHGEREAVNAVWSYPNLTENSELIRPHLAFYLYLMDKCTVDGEQIFSDSPHLYGFATNDIAGPFKGEPGTADW
jgi:hypothetical protein